MRYTNQTVIYRLYGKSGFDYGWRRCSMREKLTLEELGMTLEEAPHMDSIMGRAKEWPAPGREKKLEVSR